MPMKKVLILVYLLTYILLFNIKVYGQDSNWGPDCLGIWCLIDVDLSNSTNSSGYTEFPFSNPPEEIGVAKTIRGEVVVLHQGRVNCIGPGRPYIDNELGGAPIRCLDLKWLDMDLLDAECEALVSFPVQKLDLYGSQCYYYIKLVIKR